jgi:4-amino-4-deoxy-L-arabinose transferase-like glycosyltransferase
MSIIGIARLISTIYLGVSLPNTWDLGHYWYWGKLALEGEIPTKDFFARHPLYIYLIALSIKFFGQNIFAPIMVSIITSFLTMFVLYKISYMLYDKKVGLITCIIYAFAPTILTYSTVVDERPPMLLFVSIAILILIKALKTQNYIFLLFFGVILGFSIYVYKAVVIYLLTAPLLLAYVNMKTEKRTLDLLKKTLIQLMYIVIGFCIPALTIYAYYGIMTNFQWATYAILGLGTQQESTGYFIFGEIAPLTFKFRIFHVAIREWLYLAVPTAIFMTVLIDQTFKNNNYIKRFFINILGLSLLAILLISEHYFPQDQYGAYEPATIYKTGFLLTLIFFIVTAQLLYHKIKEKFNNIAKIKHGNGVIAYWFLSTSFMIMLYGVPLVNYYYYLAPVMTIMTALVLRIIIDFSVKEESHKCNKTGYKEVGVLFISLIVISMGIIAGMLINTPMTWRNQYNDTIQEVAYYIKEHTSENDEILTDNPAIAILAGRRVALNLMPLQLYGKVGTEPYDPLPYDPYNLIPNTQELAKYMENGKVKYVVDAAYLKNVIRLHPSWEQVFSSNYKLETTIGGVSIYVFKQSFDLSKHLS